MILLVGGEKGGSGKSCLAQNLAVYLKQRFNTEILLVDCDPQRTSSDWVQARNEQEDLPTINCVQLYGNIRNDLLSLQNRFDFVVVDCGGQDSKALRSSMAVATHAIVPLRPKRRDIKTLPHLKEAVVLTQCPSLPSQYKRIEEAKEVCRTYGLNVLDAITFNRNIYDDSEERGYTVLELEPEGKAAQEIRNIAEEFIVCEQGAADHGIARSQEKASGF
ncbi:AAA family ATPase [Agarivorans sp. B2Z047]|uniref:AAA family ATPase n=1 Tax=Agarivorans sp. B2Z047 TaxID=2652721 RepID=UPI00128AE4BD|nr:AAA family ATPase [Agarivorans sp. B2Z047]MPW30446.1 AAA family ATPase [Agarivorans sp. B2Z047]UQN42927.1 AAA family ATPase [Agarivorans sp. B2Z047]